MHNAITADVRVNPAKLHGWKPGSLQKMPDGRTIYVGPDGLIYASALSYQKLSANGVHTVSRTAEQKVALQVNDSSDLDGVAKLQKMAFDRKANDRIAREAKLFDATAAYNKKKHSDAPGQKTRDNAPTVRRRKKSLKTVRVFAAGTGDRPTISVKRISSTAREGRWIVGYRLVFRTDGLQVVQMVSLIAKEATRRIEPNVRGKGKPGSYADFLTIQCLPVEPKPKPKPKPKPRRVAKPAVKMSAEQLAARKKARKEAKENTQNKRKEARRARR